MPVKLPAEALRGAGHTVHTPDLEWDGTAADRLVVEAPDGELLLYSSSEHLFADSSLTTYDPAAADLMTQRVLDFLARL